MIPLAITTMLLLAQDKDRTFQYEPDIGCRIVTTEAGPEIQCPKVFDKDRAEHVRKLPPLKMPGHASKEGDFTPSSRPGNEKPAGCMVNQKEFVKRLGQFTGWLQNQAYSSAQDTLTREAAYNVKQLVNSYGSRVLEEARAKNAYGPRDDFWEGDLACQRHLKAGLKELYRVTELVLDELNKGNRDLEGTGLNPYANKANK